jgi:starch phosphorylase
VGRAYDGLNGFAIGVGETQFESRTHDAGSPGRWRACCATKSFRCYYDRDRDGLPREWIARMKRAIRTLGWRFSAHRMVMDYVTKSYIPAGRRNEQRCPRHVDVVVSDPRLSALA